MRRVAALPTTFLPAAKRGGLMRLPILIYHQVADRHGTGNGSASDPEDWPYRLEQHIFEAQIRSIVDQQIRTGVVEELTAKDQGAAPMSSTACKSVCLTFDDGSISDYTVAFPLLLSYGQRATFFVITDRVGQHGYVTWAQLREMTAHGMSIQSHSCSHDSLAQATLAQAREELRRSKEHLEQALGQRVVAFAPPGGSWRAELSALAEACGYHVICTSEQGVNETPFNLLALKRLSIRRTYSLRRFQALLMARRSGLFRQRFEAFCLDSAKAVLGVNRYNAIRRHVLIRASRSNGHVQSS
jgi:peptidoglycan/xylan/chitin deacetylase (PgdA/CDA1 family)